MPARIAPELASAMREAADDEPLEVVLELEPIALAPSGSRAERIALQKARFESAAAPVRASVEQAGGTIEAETWISGAIKARVPAAAVDGLCEIEGVALIDVPHRLSRE